MLHGRLNLAGMSFAVRAQSKLAPSLSDGVLHRHRRRGSGMKAAVHVLPRTDIAIRARTLQSAGTRAGRFAKSFASRTLA